MIVVTLLRVCEKHPVLREILDGDIWGRSQRDGATG